MNNPATESNDIELSPRDLKSIARVSAVPDAAELARAVSLLSATIESLPDALIAADLSGKITCYNTKFMKLWNVPVELLNQKDTAALTAFVVRQLKDPQTFLQRTVELKAAPETNIRESVELKDGRTFERHLCPQYTNGVCVGRLASWHDITDHRRTELALRSSEERFRMLWETAPDAVVLLNEHSEICYANAAMKDIFGHDPATIVGENISVLQPERLRDAHKRGFAKYLATRTKTLSWRVSETIAMHRDGHEIPVEISFSHVETNGAHQFAGFLRDISERKRAESARQLLEERLRESQKLEAMGTLAGGIAHSFNNILGAILGNVSLARKEVDDSHAAHVSLEEIHKAGVRARNLVQQILAFSRKQPQEFVDQALRPLVEETLGLLRITMPAGVALEATFGGESIFVRADTIQIEQVLMNLCTNAWHALKKESGRIDVYLDDVSISATTAPTLSIAPGRYARLTVSDNGHGMDEATRARIFEPFYTTKDEHKGTGLGLAVAHGIVKAHHGAITVQSTAGKGTRFEVLLPAVAATTAIAHAPLTPVTQINGNGQHILYVDDDEAMVFLVQRMLTNLGYRVSGYENASEALAAVRNNPNDFDLIVTDFNMPGASGVDVALELARIRADLPVVITSGYINEKLQQGARAAGVRHLVHKPNTVDELCEIIQRVICGNA